MYQVAAFPAEVISVMSYTANSKLMEHAKAAGIDTVVVGDSDAAAVQAELERTSAELVVVLNDVDVAALGDEFVGRRSRCARAVGRCVK